MFQLAVATVYGGGCIVSELVVFACILCHIAALVRTIFFIFFY